MNVQVAQSELMSPPPLLKLADTGLTPVMMQDILLRTVFRKTSKRHPKSLRPSRCRSR